MAVFLELYDSSGNIKVSINGTQEEEGAVITLHKQVLIISLIQHNTKMFGNYCTCEGILQQTKGTFTTLRVRLSCYCSNMFTQQTHWSLDSYNKSLFTLIDRVTNTML